MISGSNINYKFRFDVVTYLYFIYAKFECIFIFIIGGRWKTLVRSLIISRLVNDSALLYNILISLWKKGPDAVMYVWWHALAKEPYNASFVPSALVFCNKLRETMDFKAFKRFVMVRQLITEILQCISCQLLNHIKCEASK